MIKLITLKSNNNYCKQIVLKLRVYVILIDIVI